MARTRQERGKRNDFGKMKPAEKFYGHEYITRKVKETQTNAITTDERGFL